MTRNHVGSARAEFQNTSDACFGGSNSVGVSRQVSHCCSDSGVAVSGGGQSAGFFVSDPNGVLLLVLLPLDVEGLVGEVQEARRIKQLHQPSKVTDMEHEHCALRT
ncbi:hypothetical protein ACOSQ4_021425 [Xanthoceras sorbifolium]